MRVGLGRASKEIERRMIVCREHRLIFLSIPRTGSTAMERLLVERYGGERVDKKHSGGGVMRKWLAEAGEERASWVVVTTVRNPYDSLVSIWNKLLSNHRGKKEGPQAEAARRGEVSFGDWVEQRPPEFAAGWIQRFTRHCDEVMRFERLAGDWAALCEKRGWPHHEIPLVNPTMKEAGRGFEAYYTPEILAAVRPVFGEFCAAFGYEEPGG